MSHRGVQVRIAGGTTVGCLLPRRGWVRGDSIQPVIPRAIRTAVTLFVFSVKFSAPCAAGDWPMWRYDAQRSAAAVDDLPDELSLAWTRQYDRREQVWDDPLNHDLMPYDKVFEPIVIGDHVIVGFNDSDKVVALNAETGGEAWRFYCDGPVRLPPAAADGKVYVTSDDGHLYCLSARDGSVHWKFRGAPADQRVLGNRRLISMWPARGGAVIADKTVYFAASIWPFLGTFLYALDAETGKVQWVNDGTGSMYIEQPHSAPSFGGVAPQGAMAVSGSALVVPGGRSVPAVFDRESGDLRYFRLNEGGKGNGGSLVMANEDSFFVHTRRRGVREFNLESGKKTEIQMNEPVLTSDLVYAADDGSIVARDPSDKFKEVWKVTADGSGDLIKSGNRLYAAGEDEITAIELPPDDETKARVAWRIPVTGQILRLLAGAEKLIAVTIDGRIMAFGENGAGKRYARAANKSRRQRTPKPSLTSRASADAILKHLNTREGYALCYGVDDGALLEALVSRSQLHIVAVESDADKVQQLRQRWDDAGWYGDRLTIHQGDPLSFQAPPYIANLVLVGKRSANKFSSASYAAAMYRSVRPYGGVLCYQRSPSLRYAKLEQVAESVPLVNAEMKTDFRNIILIRTGALPGSAPWTHLYGDIANTVKSDDSLVKLPLGILWFGGNSNLDVLPRHGHGPSEQVLGGRLFIQGMDGLSARDVYTGRLLWKRVFDDMGTYNVYFDDTYKETPLDPAYNQVHLPGANLRGTNYVVTEDAIYLVISKMCYVLDPVTGQTKKEIELPDLTNGEESDAWSYVGVYEDILLAGADFANYTEEDGVKYKKEDKKGDAWNFDRFGADGLIAINRHTGQKLWELTAKHSFLHNTIIAGGGRVYMIDKLPHTVEAQLKRRGMESPDTYALKVVDAKTGELVWETSEHVFGTWLGYSDEHDILIQAGSGAPDRAKEEVDKGIIAYNAPDGSIRWQNRDISYAGPSILHGDRVITNSRSYTETSGVYSLLDGTPELIADPLTGRERPWTYQRAYGCNTAVACENLLTFRSGAAGFYDLNSKSGTGNLGGFRSGCSSNLIVADGVLNAPDYTRTCSCGYQNQTSLALVHMPHVETWTVDYLDLKLNDAVHHVGVNLGAPGDRRAPTGEMWLEYPTVSDSPLDITHDGEDVKTYRRHTYNVDESEYPWVAASGMRNLSRLSLRLAPPRPPAPGAIAKTNHAYDVRLHFAEPDDLEPGQRVFHLSVQGEKVLSDFDIVKAAGGPLRGVTHNIRDVRVESYLDIEFQNAGSTQYGPILSGIEVISKPDKQIADASAGLNES